jgi:hypothetical protein
MTILRTLAAASLCLAASFASPSSWAEGDDDWKFQAVVYLYLPSVDGETVFSGSGGSDSAGVDASKLLENLHLAFMGSFEADKGAWGLFTDVIYVDFGDSESPSRDFTLGGGTLPVGVNASLRYDLNGWLWTLAGSWHAASTPNNELNLIGGARLIDIDQTIHWQLGGNVGSVALPDRAGDRMAGVQNWDAIVGLKGRALLGSGQHWFMPYYLDVGTGESSLTWQAMFGVGYAFDWGSVTCAWRHIDYDMKSGKSVESLSFDGPGVAVAFRW